VIASLRGTVAAVGAGTAVIEVGGIGLLVQATPGTIADLRVGRSATLATTLVVREDSLTLFGFADADERDVFLTLQSVGGIGPRIALAALAVHSADALRRAVHTEDLTSLTAVPGIGRKGAQRIVLELSGKLGHPVQGSGSADTAPPVEDWRDQVSTGLVGLGWSARDADAATDVVAPMAAEMLAADELNVAGLLRAALRSLSRP